MEDTENNSNLQAKNVESKELQRLRSFNTPGTGEENVEILGARRRHLSHPAAKANYDIAKDNFVGELEQLEDPERHMGREPQLRAEYKEIKHSETKLLKAADDLKKAMERSDHHGQSEINEVDNEVVSLQTRLDAFKQGCTVNLDLETGSVASNFKSIGRTSSRVSSSSSRAKLVKQNLQGVRLKKRSS